MGSLRAALALWLCLALVAPEALHECPVHRAPGHGAMPDPGHSHHAPLDDTTQPDDHHCTCLGECCPAGIIATGFDIAAAWSPFTVDDHGSTGPVETPLPAASEHLLPFATAPPQVLRS